MFILELIGVLAGSSDTAIVVTDSALDSPGPNILYVNDAFCRLTGYASQDLIGRSPRVLQGKRTRPLVLRTLSRALRAGDTFRCVVANYRKTGEEYLCEIEAHPVRNNAGAIECFIAFEREVRRRRGNPGRDGLGRFVAVDAAPEPPNVRERRRRSGDPGVS